MAQSSFVLKLLDELWFFGNILPGSKEAYSESKTAESESTEVTESGELTDAFVPAENKSVEEEGRSMDSIYELLSSSHGHGSSSVCKDDTCAESLNSTKMIRSCNSIDSCRSSSSSSSSSSSTSTSNKDDISPSRSSGSKLTRSCSSLHTPKPRLTTTYSCCSSRTAGFDSSMTIRRRPPRDLKLAMTNKYSMAAESRWRRTFLEKKWKSLTELESEELQGFKDLGFVFDEQGVSSTLLQVIPGLRDARIAAGNESCGRIQRPYLSESWLVQQPSSPPIKLTNTRSAEEMKDQLKFWARIVACNVRDVC